MQKFGDGVIKRRVKKVLELLEPLTSKKKSYTLDYGGEILAEIQALITSAENFKLHDQWRT